MATIVFYYKNIFFLEITPTLTFDAIQQFVYSVTGIIATEQFFIMNYSKIVTTFEEIILNQLDPLWIMSLYRNYNIKQNNTHCKKLFFF